jgi:hypothetical protein
MQQRQSTPASAIAAYFDLMYDADDARYPEVFHDACVIHGLREGKLVAWSAAEFRDLMRGRPSPASTGAPRQQETVRLEQTSPDMAAARVRVRIGQIRFLDDLILHRTEGTWLVTSKAFHVEEVISPAS